MGNDQKIPEENIPHINVEELGNQKIGEGFEKPDLNGKEVTILKGELIPTNEVKKVRDGSKEYRPVIFKVYYDEQNFEYYGGLRQFQTQSGWGEPTFDPNANCAVAKLFRLWIAKMNLKTEQVSRKEFFQGLKGMKARLRNTTVQFQGKDFKKNVIESFV